MATPWAFLLFAIFLVLKLTHVVAWSWWWVTSPLWISGLLALALIGFVTLTGRYISNRL